jgi:transcription-repair coupling factor (superfamily II helicase)
VVIAEDLRQADQATRRQRRKKQILTSWPSSSRVITWSTSISGSASTGTAPRSLQGEGDFLLWVRRRDKLYLPVDRINWCSAPHRGEGVEPRVDRLGGASWEKAKARAREAVQEMAEELLKIYAARQVHEGVAFSPPDDLYREFEAAFAYEETPDQMSAIEDVLRDMESAKPMDRLA